MPNRRPSSHAAMSLSKGSRSSPSAARRPTSISATAASCACAGCSSCRGRNRQARWPQSSAAPSTRAPWVPSSAPMPSRRRRSQACSPVAMRHAPQVRWSSLRRTVHVGDQRPPVAGLPEVMATSGGRGAGLSMRHAPRCRYAFTRAPAGSYGASIVSLVFTGCMATTSAYSPEPRNSSVAPSALRT